jgi:hypothetical protein
MLLDEWRAYVRQLNEGEGVGAGSPPTVETTPGIGAPADLTAPDVGMLRSAATVATAALGLLPPLARALVALLWWLLFAARWLVAVPLLAVANVLALAAGAHPLQRRVRRWADTLFGAGASFHLGWSPERGRGRGLSLLVENVRLAGALLRFVDGATMADPLVLRSATAAQLRVSLFFVRGRALALELARVQLVVRVAERCYWDGARARERWAAKHSAHIAALSSVIERGGSRRPAGVGARRGRVTLLARLARQLMRQADVQARARP